MPEENNRLNENDFSFLSDTKVSPNTAPSSSVRDTKSPLIAQEDFSFLQDKQVVEPVKGQEVIKDQSTTDTSIFGNTANDLASSFVRGLSGTATDIAQGAERAVGLVTDDKVEDNLVFGLAEDLKKGTKDTFKLSSPEAEQEVQNQIANALGQVTGIAGGAAAAGAAGIGTAVTTVGTVIASMLAAGNQQATDYIETIKEAGGIENEEDKQAAFAAAAATSGLIDSVPVIRALRRLDKTTGGMASKTIAESVKRGGKELAKNTIKGALEEGTTEAIQTIANNLIASDLVRYDKDRKVFEQVREGAEVGAGAGAALNAAMTLLGLGRRARSRGKFESVEGTSDDSSTPDLNPMEEAVKVANRDEKPVNPVTTQPFSSSEVEASFKDALKQAETKVDKDQEGLDTSGETEVISSKIEELKAIAEGSSDPAIDKEVGEAIQFLETIVKNDTSQVLTNPGKDLENITDPDKKQSVKEQTEALAKDLSEAVGKPVEPNTDQDANQDTDQDAISGKDLGFLQDDPGTILTEDAGSTERRRKGLREAVEALPEDKKVVAIEALKSKNEDLVKRLYTSTVASIPNKAAYQDTPKKKYQASIDIDSLKFLNDSLGHEGGDSLIAKVAQAISKELPGDTFHVSGDEIVAQSDSPQELGAALERAQEALKSESISGTDIQTGKKARQDGLSFTFGIDKDLSVADRNMIKQKEKNTALGLRAPRGEAPAGFKILEDLPEVDTESVENLPEQDLGNISERIAELEGELEFSRNDPFADKEEVQAFRKELDTLKKTEFMLKASKGDRVNTEESLNLGDLEIDTEINPETHEVDSSVLYSVGEGARPDTTVEPKTEAVSKAVTNTFSNFSTKLRSGLNLQADMVDSIADLPKDIREGVKASNAVAVFKKGKGEKPARIYFIKDNITSPAHFTKVALHEIVGHFGLRSVIDSAAGKGKFDNFLDNLLNTTPEVRKDILRKVVRWRTYLDSWMKNNNLATYPSNRKIELRLPEGGTIEIPDVVARRLAEEYISDLSAQRMMSKKFTDKVGVSRRDKTIHKSFSKFIKKIRHTLRKVFGNFGSTLRDSDIDSAIAASAEFVFSKDAEIDFSNYVKKNLDLSTTNITEFDWEANKELQEEARKIAKKQSASDVDLQAVNKLLADGFGELDGVPGERYIKNKALKTAWGTKLSNFLANKMRNTRGLKGFTRLGSLNSQQAYRNIEKVVFSKHAELDQFLSRTRPALNKLNAVQKKLVLQYMRTPGADLESVPVPEDTKIFIRDAKDKIEFLGEQLKDMGMISEMTFEENRGGYLTTLYAKYYKEVILGGKKTSFLNWTKKKSDIPSEIKAELGKIEDPALLIAETVGTMQHDAAVLNMYKAIKDLSAEAGLNWIVDSDFKVSYDRRSGEGSEKVTRTLDELEKDIGRMEMDLKIKKETTTLAGQSGSDIQNILANIDAAKDALEKGRADMEQQLKGSIIEEAKNNLGEVPPTYFADNYSRMPKEKRYGALAGKYVRKEIKSDIIKQFDSLRGQDLNFWSKAMQKASQANSHWKFLKAVASPAQHVRNAVNNMALLDISSRRNSATLSYWATAGIMNRLSSVQALSGLNDSGGMGKYQQIHDRVAGGDNTFVNRELANIRTDAKDIIAEYQDYEKNYKSWNAVTRMIRTASLYAKLYQNSASNFMGMAEKGTKDAAIRDYIETWEVDNGKKFDDLDINEQDALALKAVERANQDLFDYGDVPAAVEDIRRSPVGAPFLTYTYKVLPALIRGAVNNPHKLMLQTALPGLITALSSYMLSDLDEEEAEKLTGMQNDYYKKTGAVAVLPFKDSDGTFQFIDLSYALPHTVPYKAAHSVMTDETTGMLKPLSIAEKLLVEELGILGGFAPQQIVALATNQDSFGRKIIDTTAPGEVQLSQFAKYVGNSVAPGMLVPGGPIEKMFKSVSGNREVDRDGKPKYTFGQAFGQFVGFGAKKLDEQSLRRSVFGEFRAKKRELDFAKSRVRKDRNLSQEEKAARFAEIRRQKMAIVDKKLKRLGVKE